MGVSNLPRATVAVLGWEPSAVDSTSPHVNTTLHPKTEEPQSLGGPSTELVPRSRLVPSSRPFENLSERADRAETARTTYVLMKQSQGFKRAPLP